MSYLHLATAAAVAILAGALIVAAAHRVRPSGHHRASAPDMAVIDALVAVGQAEPGGNAWCPACARTTYHALPAGAPRRCWTCNTEEPGQ